MYVRSIFVWNHLLSIGDHVWRLRSEKNKKRAVEQSPPQAFSPN